MLDSTDPSSDIKRMKLDRMCPSNVIGDDFLSNYGSPVDPNEPG